VKEIFKIISEIHAEGRQSCWWEQNARKALAIAEYAYVIETGRIVLEGPAQTGIWTGQEVLFRRRVNSLQTEGSNNNSGDHDWQKEVKPILKNLLLLCELSDMSFQLIKFPNFFGGRMYLKNNDKIVYRIGDLCSCPL
jgi:hypothetical protein